MEKSVNAITIIRCQLSEDACPPEEWKKHINNNPDFQKFCIDMEEIAVVFMDCKGCQKNKNEAEEIKTIASQIVENGVGTVFLTRCMCRNIKNLKSYIGVKGGDLGWIDIFGSFCRGCIDGLGEKEGSSFCMLYQDRIKEKCPNSAASHLLEFIKTNYPWVTIIIKK
jgi:hypothetical protein